jgi:hypothetical protein
MTVKTDTDKTDTDKTDTHYRIDLDNLHLRDGGHSLERIADGEMCAMEAASVLAGQPEGDDGRWIPSDRDERFSDVISYFIRTWNDHLKDDDRDRLLIPLLPRLISTGRGEDAEVARSWMVLDWLVRDCAPRWLRFAGMAGMAGLAGLDAHADELAAMTELTAETAMTPVMIRIGAAWEAAASAGNYTSAYSPRGAIESAAVFSATYTAKYTANHAAKYAIDCIAPRTLDVIIFAAGARVATAVVDGYRATDAAWDEADDLRATVEACQESALRLLDKMIGAER